MITAPLLVRLVVGAVLSVAVLGCGDDEPAVDADATAGPPDRIADYRGELTSVTAFEPVTEDCTDRSDADPDDPVSNADPPTCTDPDTAPLGHVLLEEMPGAQDGDKISLRVDPATPIFRSDAGSVTAATFDDLSEGASVEAWVDGPVAESYPEQGTASALVVTGSG